MDQIWLTSPCPAMRVWPGSPGASWQLNPAAFAWGREIALNENSWAAVAAELSAAHHGSVAREGRLASVGVRWRSLPMNTGWLVWLTPDSAAAARDEAWGSALDKLELVQQFGRIGLFERDIRSGVGRWDAHMFRLLGFDPADGTPSWHEGLARVHPNDVDRFVAAHQRFVTEPGRHSVRYRVVIPGGPERDLHTFAEVRRGPDGQPGLMIGVVLDDTESAGRIRDQEAISARLADALSLAQISVWRLDLDLQRIHLNDVGYGLMGMAPVAGGVPLETVRAFYHPDDAVGLAQASHDALNSESVIDLEARYLFPGRSAPLRMLTRRVAERDESGRAIGLLGVALDQTERIAEREHARALAQRIELVADTAGFGIYSVDVTTGETEWNLQMFRVHGLAEDTAAPSFDQFVSKVIHPDDRIDFVHHRTRAFQAAEGFFEGEVRIVHPDGSVHWIEHRSRRTVSEGRTIIFGIALDVTQGVMQRAEAEKSLRDKEAAEQANAAKSQFFARMSHDLRTPLNAVLGFAQLIEHEGDTVPFPVQLERVVHIRQAGQQLLELVGDVLDRMTREGLTDSGTLASTEAADEAARPAPAAAPPLGNALKVLYIEDNPVNVILVEELVGMRANTTLHCAADGLSGVAWAEAGQPDVVLVDMQLPDIDGFEVLRRLRGMRSLNHSAIIALSANGMSDDIALARAAGFDDYWTKPIDFRHFLRGLDRLAAAR